jgi:hypothetical protein
LLFKESSTQPARVYSGADMLDEYFGSADSVILSSGKRKALEFDCLSDTAGNEKLVRITTYDKNGRIDSIMEGGGLNEGLFDQLVTYTYSYENKRLVVTCLRQYFYPINFYRYGYLFEKKGNALTLRWPKSKDGSVEIKTRYEHLSPATIRKKQLDGMGNLRTDTVILQNVTETLSLTEKKDKDCITRITIFKESGIKFKRLDHVIDGQVKSSDFFRESGTEFTSIFTTLFLYNVKGQLVKEIKYVLNSNRVIDTKELVYVDGHEKPDSTIVYEYASSVKRVYDRDQRLVEIAENELSTNGSTRVKMIYENSGLLARRQFYVNNKKVSETSYEYK